MKFWITVLCIALLLAPKAFADDPSAADSTDADDQRAEVERDDERTDDRRAIEAHLSHYHELPDRQTLEEASDQAREIVFEIARDDDAFLMHRQRAMKVLTHWADQEVYDYLIGLLDDQSTEDGLRHHLLPVLADGFGQEALEDIKPYLTDASDPQIRISAAGAIAHNIPGDRAADILADALEDEDASLVREQLRDYIERHR